MSCPVLRSKYIVVSIVFFVLASAIASCFHSPEEQPHLAVVLQDWDDPVAVIGMLPDTVLVGTEIFLNGSGSYDDSGNIVDYSWEISCWDTVDRVYGVHVSYTVTVPGLNTIRLTVTDSVGKTGSNYTAVMCVRADGTSYPVAVISPLPSMVSNGTWQTLNGTRSYTYNASNEAFSLDSFMWEITEASSNSTVRFEGRTYPFKFKTLGLYTIKLTVTDLAGNIGQAYTAVVSVLDSDGDELPDWWEELYWDNLELGKADDPDHDGYTNLQEYAAGTNPMVADPPPKGFLENNWMYIAAAAAAVVVVVLALLPGMKRRRKEAEKKKIAYAIEIEKALDEEK